MTNQAGNGLIDVASLLSAISVCGALLSIFVPINYLPYVTAVVVILAGADFILYQAPIWKIMVVAGLVSVSWSSTWVLPADLLTTAAPFERVYFRIKHPEVVAANDKLGEYVQVGGYELRLLSGYHLLDTLRQPDGSAWVFGGPRRDNGGAPTVTFVLMPLPAGNTRIFDELSPAQIVRRVLLPKLVRPFDLPEIVQQDGEAQEINGLSFYTVSWAGVTRADALGHTQKVRGKIYVARDDRHKKILAYLSCDQDPYATANAPLVEAAAYTLRPGYF